MKLLCFGDSNTYGYDPRSFLGDRYPAQYRWADLLAQKLGCEIINEGRNGRTIPRREGELADVRRLLALYRDADLLVILLGTNDLLQGATAEVTARRMEAFLEQLGNEKAKVLLIGPPPMKRGEWVPDQMLIDASNALNRQYKALAEQLEIRFADARHWSVELAFDGVHFSEAGNRAFAEGLFQYLNKGE